MDRYYTTAELAGLYRTTPSTIRYWRHTGYGPNGVKVGRRVLYAESEVRRWDETVRSSGAPAA